MAVKKKKTTKKPVKKVKKAVKKAAVKKKAVKRATTKKPVKKAAKKTVKKATKKPVKKTAKKVKKAATKKKAAKKTVKKSAPKSKKTTKKTVKKAVKPTLTKPAARPKKATPARKTAKQPIKKKPMTTASKQRTSKPSTRSKTLLGALEFTPYHPQKNEDYMGDEQLAHFRNILNAWKLQLMKDVDLTVGHLKEDAVFYADPVDRASQEEGFSLELRTRDRERKLIKKIEQSIDLINTGDYGFCEDCGAEIGILRLEARPTAVKCIDCKTIQEIREKQLGG